MRFGFTTLGKGCVGHCFDKLRFSSTKEMDSGVLFPNLIKCVTSLFISFWRSNNLYLRRSDLYFLWWPLSSFAAEASFSFELTIPKMEQKVLCWTIIIWMTRCNPFSDSWCQNENNEMNIFDRKKEHYNVHFQCKIIQKVVQVTFFWYGSGIWIP